MSVGVVLPVHNGGALLSPCLTAVMREAKATGATVVVVDDASTDDSASEAARAGARVLRRATAGGPYVARNEGWRSLDVDHVVFVDARCRPHSGWLQALVASLEDPACAIAGGDVHALTGPRPAQRYVAKWQPLAPEHGLGHPFLPFLPTCNVVTRRSVLEAVDGFRPMRSGGDLDFSWRVQLAGLGQVRYAPGAGVDWVPRETVREVRRQWYRYGSAKPALWADYSGAGLTVDPPRPAWKFAYGEARALLKALTRTRPSQWDVEVVDRLCQLAFYQGYVKQWRTTAGLPG